MWNGNWDVVEYYYISMIGLIFLVGVFGCNFNLFLCELILFLFFFREKNLFYKGYKMFYIRLYIFWFKIIFLYFYNKYVNEWRKLEIVFLVCY